MSESGEFSTASVATEPEVVVSIDGVTVRRMASSGRLTLRGRDGVREAAYRALGLSDTNVACRAAVGGTSGVSALWLGPDEWLLLVPPSALQSIRQRLAEALGGSPHGLVDTSDRQIAFEISGGRAAEVIGIGCPLDLDLPHFPAGSCTRTLLGKSEIVLWRKSDEAFQLEVARSFSSYVAGVLACSATAIAP